MWLDFRRGQHPKNYGGENFRQTEKPTGLTLYLGQIITLCLGQIRNLYLGLCCITNIVQHSVFVEFSRMLASRLKECKGCESKNPPAGVVLLREERYSRMIRLIRKRRLLARGARLRPLRPFPTTHPVTCTFFFSMHVLLWCVLLWCAMMCVDVCWCVLMWCAMMCVAHQPLGCWRHYHFCVFCVYDFHQPLSYGCWYWLVGMFWFYEPRVWQRHEKHLCHTPALELLVQS